MDFFRKLTRKGGEDRRTARKMISVLLPVYNEYDNIMPLGRDIVAQLEQLPQYDHELVIIDNCSDDGTRDLLHMMCARDRNVKAIFNARNFGRSDSQFYGMCQCSGDCVICMSADYQDPPELIPELIGKWENGAEIVLGVNTDAREDPCAKGLLRLCRAAVRRLSRVKQPEGFAGFALYDRSFVDLLASLDDPEPYLGGDISRFGCRCEQIPYERQPRRSGTSSLGFRERYDELMRALVNGGRGGTRVASAVGAAGVILSLIAAIVCAAVYIIRPGCFSLSAALTVIGVCFFGSLQLFFTGLLGEYIASVSVRTARRPLVIEEKRLNFDDGDD